MALAKAGQNASKILLPKAPKGKAVDKQKPSSPVQAPVEAKPPVPALPEIHIEPSVSEVNIQRPVSLDPAGAIAQSEVEAANLLIHLGVSADRLNSPQNFEARNSITGAYRIMLHKLQR